MQRNRWRSPQWIICHFCGAQILQGESKMFCCSQGQHIVPPLPALPEHLSLLANNCLDISKTLRKLNNLFCLTAIGATQGFHQFNTGHFPLLFLLQMIDLHLQVLRLSPSPEGLTTAYSTSKTVAIHYTGIFMTATRGREQADNSRYRSIGSVVSKKTKTCMITILMLTTCDISLLGPNRCQCSSK